MNAVGLVNVVMASRYEHKVQPKFGKSCKQRLRARVDVTTTRYPTRFHVTGHRYSESGATCLHSLFHIALEVEQEVEKVGSCTDALKIMFIYQICTIPEKGKAATTIFTRLSVLISI